MWENTQTVKKPAPPEPQAVEPIVDNGAMPWDAFVQLSTIWVGMQWDALVQVGTQLGDAWQQREEQQTMEDVSSSKKKDEKLIDEKLWNRLLALGNGVDLEPRSPSQARRPRRRRRHGPKGDKLSMRAFVAVARECKTQRSHSMPAALSRTAPAPLFPGALALNDDRW